MTAWIACFAILLASLAPSISHALAAADGSSGVFGEICTVGGTKWTKSGGQDAKVPSPVQKVLHVEHCPFCLPHSGAMGLPPSALLQLPLLNDGGSQPVLFYQSPRPLFIWTTAQSRAPPLF